MFTTNDEADAAIKTFFETVSSARDAGHIADVLIVIHDTVKHEDGNGVFLVLKTLGDRMCEQEMAAYAYGKLTADRRVQIMELLAGEGYKMKKRLTEDE